MEETKKQLEPWQTAMKHLIKKLKEADKHFNTRENDRIDMLNFSKNVSHVYWKDVIESQEAQDELRIIKNSLIEEFSMESAVA